MVAVEEYDKGGCILNNLFFKSPLSSITPQLTLQHHKLYPQSDRAQLKQGVYHKLPVLGQRLAYVGQRSAYIGHRAG